MTFAGGESACLKVLEEAALRAPTQIIALGKAAPAMALGALRQFGSDVPTLVVTKYDHALPELTKLHCVELLEAAHPIPDANSLAAGQSILTRVQSLGADDRLLLLVSGGASALAEVLVPGVTFADLQALNKEMISQDKTIEEINRARMARSKLKAGGLLSHFAGAHVDVVFISDVRHDDPKVIGSGVGTLAEAATHGFTYASHFAANNALSRHAIAEAAEARGLTVVDNHESLYGEISDLSKALADQLRTGAPGVYIWGGEPVVNLPDNPGSGGRNQALALLLARELSGTSGIVLACGGTDGTDGPTDAAGGVIDGETYRADLGHEAAIAQANAGPALAAVDSLLTTGPTGTNVMDIIVAIKAAT